MKKLNGLFILVSSILVMACGSSSTRDFTVSGLGDPGTGGSGTSTTGPGTTGNIYNLPLAPEFEAVITGTNGSQPTATQSYGTSQLVRVKVTPRSAPNLLNSTYQNWVFPYGCLRLRVTVNGVTRSTNVLKVGDMVQGANSPCANASESQILDFSNTTTGSAPISVTISNADYDNCRQYWPMNYGCYMSAVFANHVVGATIAVQTDGTYLEE